MSKKLCLTLTLALLLALVFCASALAAGTGSYDLKICGVQVTDANRADILGDGVFSFDGDRTLYVWGDCDAGDHDLIFSGIPGLVIDVETDASFKASERVILDCLADTTLTGGHTLRMNPGRYTAVFMENGASTAAMRRTQTGTSSLRRVLARRCGCMALKSVPESLSNLGVPRTLIRYHSPVTGQIAMVPSPCRPEM